MMTTPWEHLADEEKDLHYADYAAWERWIREEWDRLSTDTTCHPDLLDAILGDTTQLYLLMRSAYCQDAARRELEAVRQERDRLKARIEAMESVERARQSNGFRRLIRAKREQHEAHQGGKKEG